MQNEMEEVYQEHQKILASYKIEFRRDLLDEIAWNEKMIAIKGARGVGKSTLMIQHIIETFKKSSAVLYISMDNLMLVDKSIWEIAQYHAMQGGTHLFIDEIHKYENWSIELKNIYDRLPQLSVVFSSSSILQIYKGYADLSRRVVDYQLFGLSFREYIQIETKKKFVKYSLEEILENHLTISEAILTEIKPIPLFKSYLAFGYYPFYLQGKNSYYKKLNTITSTILEVDMPYILGINIQNISKIKRLLKIIAGAVPFQPNISKLAESLNITRGTLTQYLYYLEQASLVSLLTLAEKSYSQLTKPEKIFLQNSNLNYAINGSTVNVGTSREQFFYNQLSAIAQVNFSNKGDFSVNEKYTFEIGGEKKDFSQIADIENSYLAIDETEIGFGKKIPLWLFGFLY
jgi:uncharacterized protein